MKQILVGFLCLLSVAALAQPQRIVALHDSEIALPLIELGAPVVGSTGRIIEGKAPFIRGVDVLLGTTAEALGISIVGDFEPDLEKVAALQPDLIIGYFESEELADKLNAIAPTVLLSRDYSEMFTNYRKIAAAAGKEAEFERLYQNYQSQLTQLTAEFEQPSDIRIAAFSANSYSGFLNLYHEFGAFSQVVKDAGFANATISGDSENRGWMTEFSVEAIDTVEADYLVDVYAPDYGETLAVPAENLNKLLPSWCEHLSACANGNYFIWERTKVTSTSFVALEYVIEQFISQIALREVVALK